MSETVIRLENVTKKFGNFTAVDSINLEVTRGETVGLVGPNGAGKTTTIKMIAKILRPNTGKILIRTDDGKLENIQKISRTFTQLGFLIDIPSFYNMTAYELLKYFAKLQNYPKDKIEERIDELLELFELSEWKHENVKDFSKGMTQKLGIIQAIIHDPDLIILDEPQTGLDPLSRIEIRKYIRKLQSQGKTIFVASHMLYEISEVCDKIALINHGKIAGFDTVENLARRLKTNEVDFEILENASNIDLNSILERLTSRLEKYLDKNIDPMISKEPITYVPNDNIFKIYYEGDDESRHEILKILVTEFSSDFKLVSFSQPRTSQLERVYTDMVRTQDRKPNSKSNGDDNK